MKILFIAGGDSAHSHRWISWFLEQDTLQIGWISLRDTFDLANEHKYHISPAKKVFKPAALNLLISSIINLFRVLAWKPDCIHIHYMGLNGILGLILPSKVKVFSAWGDDILFPKYPRILSLMIKRANFFTVDAVHMKDRLIELGADEQKIHLINFGIETDKFQKKSTDSKYRKKIFNNSHDSDPIIISLRNHDPVYDIPTLLNAIPLVLKEIPNAKFSIGGHGPLTNSLKEHSKVLGVEAAICFFGKYTHDDLPHLFAQSSLYVSTSLSDAGIAASTAEAMACEVPVVVSDTGENNQWIENGVNGLLFQAKDHVKLAELIIELLLKDSYRNNLGKEGRKVVVEKNDYNNEMHKMLKLY